MSTQVNGLIIDVIKDEWGNDVSNTDEWRGYEFTVYFTNGTMLNISKGSGEICIDLRGRIDETKN